MRLHTWHIQLRVLLLMAIAQSFSAQAPFTFSVTSRPEVCSPGGAGLKIDSLKNGDVTDIEWSSGERGFMAIKNLPSGDHWVKITIVSKHDSTIVTTDSTLFFRVEKEICPVGVPKHFSPNDDGYHDVLSLSNIQKHPNFEFRIFNRWGQQVHFQQKTYTPWRGNWNGVVLPDGTYYYVLIYDAADKLNLQKGDITILR